MPLRMVPLACAEHNQLCRVEISEDQLAGRDHSVGCWRVKCADCGRETNVGFVLKYGSEAA